MRTFRLRTCLLAPLALLLLSQCQWLAGYEDFSSNPSESGGPCSELPAVKEDALSLAVMSRVNVPRGTCFWIDQKEVTVEAYQRWQAEVAADEVTWESTFCKWKTTRTDPIGDTSDSCRARVSPFDLLPFALNKPMRCVDFCEAEAFCRWGKKHLCHATDAFGVQGPRDPVREWVLACSNASSTAYPWGNDPQATLCNVGQTSDSCIRSRAVCGALPVGEKRECTTRNGVVDLLGNVSEWVYSCNVIEETDATPTGCMIHGGGYDRELLSCGKEITIASDTREPSVGFRCCADLSRDEEVIVANPSAR